MPTFRGGTSGQGPLLLQLSAPVGTVARAYSIYAVGESTSGETSRPAVSRPSVIGSGNSIPVVGTSGFGTPQCVLTDSFSSPVSTPDMAPGPYALPISVRWEVPRRMGIVIGGQGVLDALLLYATTSGGHTWTGQFDWEEL